MIDLPAMAPCPVRKGGRHSLSALFSSDGDHDMTLFCGSCGALRRVPMDGEVSVPLDAMTPAQISAAVMSADEVVRRVRG